jgi:hypothetical protein
MSEANKALELQSFQPVLKPNSRFTLNGSHHAIPNVMQTSGSLRF